jgi:hypothetical protein
MRSFYESEIAWLQSVERRKAFWTERLKGFVCVRLEAFKAAAARRRREGGGVLKKEAGRETYVSLRD